MIKKLIKKIIYRLRGQYTIEQLIEMGLKVGKNFNPQLGVELDPSHCWLIEIGDNVTIAPHVQVLAHDASTCFLVGYAKIGKVKIGDNVFIGANSVILPNVQIGDNSIIGAGSVVCQSVPPNVVYGGNPATFIMTIEEFKNKHEKLLKDSTVFSEKYTLRENISSELKQEQKEKLESGIGYVK